MRSFKRLVVAASAAFIVTGSAIAQSDLSNEQLVEDLIHYQKIDQREAFEAVAKELLGRGIAGAEFVDLVTAESRRETRFNEAIAGAMQEAGLEEYASQLFQLFEGGKLEKARQPSEIATNISLLGGRMRARLLARERLAVAGEYAMPQLLETFLQTDDPQLKAEIQKLMVFMGRQSIQPLVTSLPHLDEARQELVVNVLGQIDYQTSLPYIADLRDSTGSPEVRSACQTAIARLGGSGLGLTTSELYLEQANDYYDEKRGLTSFPGEDIQLVWQYDPGIGLVMIPIATDVFHEALAMRASERSLVLNRENPEALALWVASNFSREIDSPEGYDNPTYSADRPEAMYFAVASGVDVTQRVLARAIDDRDTQLARKAIAAIERTAGGNTLWRGVGVRSPLVEALSYPNRRVQFESALALGSAQPTAPFGGAERVVPTLASAIRDPATQYAVVLTGDPEQYAGLRDLLQGMGYTVLPRGRSFNEITTAIAEAPGIDLIVTSLTSDATTEAVREARASNRMAATPLLSLVPASEYTRMRRRFDLNRGVALRALGINDAQFRATIDDLVRVTSGGPVSPEEARDYAERALRVLRDLAVSRSTVFTVGDATLPLIAAMDEYTGRMRLSIADVIARIGQDRAQVALMDEALSASGEERVALLGYTADSAKRFGNLLESRQVRQLISIAREGDRPEATAAAAAMGALNLPNENLLPLIIGE